MNFDSNFEQEQAQAWDTRTSGTRTVETMAWDLTLGKSPRRTHTHTLLVTTTTKGRRGMKTLSDPLKRKKRHKRELEAVSYSIFVPLFACPPVGKLFLEFSFFCSFRTDGLSFLLLSSSFFFTAASAEATTVSSVSTDSNFAEDASERTPRTSVSRR